MKWSAILIDFKENMGIISPRQGNRGEIISIPIEYLPKGSKIGDVLQFRVSFDPFNTLTALSRAKPEDY